jgi:hypothetical protein
VITDATVKIKRWFGEDKDREAIRQLNLEGDWTITMASVDVDYLCDDALDRVVDQFDSYANPEEVVNAARETIRRVRLPKGFMLIGMTPVDTNSEEITVLGIVDFSNFN